MTTVPVPSTSWPTGDPSTACLVLDFDGVLAPIVDDPAASAMPAGTRAVVARLAAGLGRVAVVSGRSAHFLKDRVDVDGVRMVGLYGLEQVTEDEVQHDPRVEPHLDALDAARAALAELVGQWPGAELEDKGLALAVHWRRAEDRDAAGAALTNAVRDLADDGSAAGLAVEDGKMVIELRPPIEADKGTAVHDLAEGFADVAYAGDDLGDLPAFAAVTARGGLAVAVDHGRETDARVRDAADLVVEGTEGLAAWLTGLADAIQVQQDARDIPRQ